MHRICLTFSVLLPGGRKPARLGAIERGHQRDARIDAAIVQCPTNGAAAIPVLERALQDAKVDLSSRS
ncbi:MAG: hypothetical protein J0J01_26185 [Reyranella sp.]|uniref:hypothetical protein n=1 Tax=Reyranella sp. TaxID=1929291 RepID=UPI001AD5DF89|nr:hypothetical protein [Reyranella sp.]MBN9090417.1 hypothetical protein [Reyranella sp.]